MAARQRDWDVTCKVYVGNLDSHTTKSDLEEAFSKFGPLRNVWVARSPPGFAFIEFEDPRDAQDACGHLDGTRLSGNRIKVEMSTGQSRAPRGDRRDAGRSGGYGGGGSYGGGRRDFGRRRSGSRSPPPRRRDRSRSPRPAGRDRYSRSRSTSAGPRARRERSLSK